MILLWKNAMDQTFVQIKYISTFHLKIAEIKILAIYLQAFPNQILNQKLMLFDKFSSFNLYFKLLYLSNNVLIHFSANSSYDPENVNRGVLL